MPPLLPVAALAALTLYGARWARREWRRINAELDEIRPETPDDRPVLRRDPETGDWRPAP
ncbi:hypothetical protein [Terrihabitans sp. B22-R8]|uniref:hypothetical protein n=1 Tax=Terrihabitans sp. B22-R8 TaxID=3425128 RepID=UPI00403D0F13